MDTYTTWCEEARVVTIPATDAVAGMMYELPGSVLYSILSFSFDLVTEGDAANRQVVAQLLDSTGALLFAEAAPAVQTAGLTVQYSFAGDRQPFGTLALRLMGGGFVRGRLPQNLSVGIAVGAAHAGDRLTNIRLLVHQLEPQEAGFVPAN